MTPGLHFELKKLENKEEEKEEEEEKIKPKVSGVGWDKDPVSVTGEVSKIQNRGKKENTLCQSLLCAVGNTKTMAAPRRKGWFGLRVPKGKSPSGQEAAGSRHGSRDRVLRTHILKQTESMENLEWGCGGGEGGGEALKPRSLPPRDTPARPHFLNCPKQCHYLGTKGSNTCSYEGHSHSNSHISETKSVKSVGCWPNPSR